MIEHSNQNLLTHQLIRSVDRAVRFTQVGSSHLFLSSCSLLAHVTNIRTNQISTLAELNNEEQKALALIKNIIGNIFDLRRQNLAAKLSPKDTSFSKDQILASAKQMLLDDEMTHHEGLQLVGELVSTLTYFQSPTIESLQEIKELETETMDHIKLKLNLALEAIQVQQGFLTKQ